MNAVSATTAERLARAAKPAEDALRLHSLCRGKMQTLPKCPIRGFDDFAVWYSPGVAAPSRVIVADPEAVWEHTSRGNTIAIVTDGTRVLGLGDIGPEAALPVMEGKALLFKYLGGVDAVPICLATRDPDELVHAVELLEPSFGAINLEDIAQPKCFRVLDALRARLRIPVWHDDQQGTATALLAGLLNAARGVGKEVPRMRIAMIGMGAANVACYRLLTMAGVDPQGIVACDRRGILHKGRDDIERRQGELREKWRVCIESNRDAVTGGIREALRGGRRMRRVRGVGPRHHRAGVGARNGARCDRLRLRQPGARDLALGRGGCRRRVVATGRSDFPNQLNNSLVFPGLFRGALDVRARSISDGMAIAVAHALAAFAEARGLREDHILHRLDEWDVHARVAVAAAMSAQADGLARVARIADEVAEAAAGMMRAARESTAALMRAGLIPACDGDPVLGGSVATPDQDVVDELGRALGVEQELDDEVRMADEILHERDRRRWKQEE